MFSDLNDITISTSRALRLGGVPGRWTLRRAWPRREGHVLLEYVDPSGTKVAGQWLVDQTRLDRVCQETNQSGRGAACIVDTRGCRVLLQSDGADRRLPGIDRVCGLLESSELLVHRPERRAVLRGRCEGNTVYAKVTRPGASTIAAINAGQLGARSVFRDSVSSPQLIQAEPDQGVAIWSEVPGVSLHDLLAAHTPPHAHEIKRIAFAISTSLAQIHTSPPMPTQPLHSPDDEAAILSRWLDHLRWACPDRARHIESMIESVCHRLASLPRICAPIHRDLHDKQILIDAQGGIGILDFDTLAMGDPALDLGNLIAHARLRVTQGVWCPRIAEHFVAALLDSARLHVTVRTRLDVWIEAASLRLACLYVFRPRWSQIVFDTLTSPASIDSQFTSIAARGHPCGRL